MRYLIILLMFLTHSACFAHGKADSNAQSVSMINLIATPEKYHGKVVRVIGVVEIKFEGTKICLSKESCEYSLSSNALWMELNYEKIGKTKKELRKYNGRYVLIEGTFNKDYHGHMDMYSGEIENITRYQLWERQ